MSSENRGGNPTHTNPPVYTIYPGGQQGSTNYGVQPSHPQAPPPKYEDVVSGEYLKRHYTGYEQPPSVTHEHGGPGCRCNCSQRANQWVPPPPEPELSRQDEPKEKSNNTIGAFLFGFLLIVIFIWRVWFI